MTRVLFAALALGVPAQAQEAHLHGVSSLEIAIEGGQVGMRLHAPAADIVGFEHAPNSAAEQAMMVQARTILHQPEPLFGLTPAAACAATDVDFSGLLSNGEHGDDDHHGDDDDHDKDYEHDHGEEHDHDDERAEIHDHDDKAHAGDEHADIVVTYHLHCDNPDALSGLETTFFAAFPNAASVDVKLLTETGTVQKQLTRGVSSISLD